jgi:hypothetical protein
MSTATATRERPILFSGPMVRAILAGRKTQTRRIVKFSREVWKQPLPHVEYADDGMPIWFSSPPHGLRHRDPEYFKRGYPCPYGRPGDRLWVRETWQPTAHGKGLGTEIHYHADESSEWRHGFVTNPSNKHWRPSIHMPRWASRITLEITGVRVERLNEISEEDAIAEGAELNACDPKQWTPDMGYLPRCPHYPDGCDCDPAFTARDWFSDLWESINGPGSWAENPWVWVVEFRRVES